LFFLLSAQTRQEVEADAVTADVLISITSFRAGRNAPAPVNPGHFPHGVPHLSFHDMALSQWQGRQEPQHTDIDAMITFAQKIRRQIPQAYLAIRYLQGRSRSAVLAVVVTAGAYGTGELNPPEDGTPTRTTLLADLVRRWTELVKLANLICPAKDNYCFRIDIPSVLVDAGAGSNGTQRCRATACYEEARS